MAESTANSKTQKYCIEFSDVEAAAKRIEGIAHRTPVLTSSTLDEMAESLHGRNMRLYFKVEALQKTGSFKFRGALNAVQSILKEQEEADGNRFLEVVTHSSGNHAQALALAAKLSSSKPTTDDTNATTTTTVRATIVMPESTPLVKKRAVEAYGGIPVMTGNSNLAREDKAEEIRKETGASFIHPSEDPRVIAGQGTVCLEFLQQIEKLDTVIIPVGGGGLAAGNTVSLRALEKIRESNQRINIVLAEPEEMDDAKRSFYAQQLLSHDPENPLNSVADGLKTTLGPNTWPIVRDLVDDICTVSEEKILQATKLIWERLKVCIEPSAGVGVAVAMFSPEFKAKYSTPRQTDGSSTHNVGIILCGGNVDVLKVSQLMRDAGL